VDLNSKQEKARQAVFSDPTPANVAWDDIESLLKACGAEISEGRGSRVRCVLNGVRAIFHRPHPQREAGRGLVRQVRRFLTEAGIEDN
jgi:hypothetical protein